MTQRKVGQDMIMRKKPLTATRVVSAAPVRKITQPTQTMQKIIPKRTVRAPEVVEEEKYIPMAREIRNQRNDAFFNQANNSFGNNHSNRPPARGGVLWVFVGVAMLVLITTIFSLISRSTIDVTLTESVYPIDTPITLYTEPTSGQVAFKTAQIVDKQSIIVPTTQKQTVSAIAKGTVKLFSSNPKPVTIPAGTNLLSTSQKMFITKKAVTIPAGTKDSPKSALVEIAASAPGAEYNIKLDDLKLPAFPSILARTTTEISGGISGDQFIITEPELITAKTSIQTMMQGTNPAAFLANQIPENFILPESLLQVSPIVYRTESVATGVSVIGERTITGNMIDKKMFQDYLENQIIPEQNRLFMDVIDITKINFALPPLTMTPVASSEITPSTQLFIRASGSFIARARFDETLARTKIAHQKKSAATAILQSIPGVIGANIRMWPPWIGRIPEKVSAIIFKTNYKNPESL